MLIIGTWNYTIMMTGKNYGVTVISGNKCVCGSTPNREVRLIIECVYITLNANFSVQVSISRTDNFNTEVVDGQHRTLHVSTLCYAAFGSSYSTKISPSSSGGARSDGCH